VERGVRKSGGRGCEKSALVRTVFDDHSFGRGKALEGVGVWGQADLQAVLKERGEKES